MLSASSLILLTSKGRIVLQLRDDKDGVYYRGCWGLIGGAGLEGESPVDCMVRECLEETGWRPNYLRSLFEIEEHCKETVFVSFINSETQLTCHEGRRLDSFSFEFLKDIKLSPYHQRIIDKFRSEYQLWNSSGLKILFYTKVLPPAFGGYVSAGYNLYQLLSSEANVKLVTDSTLNSLDNYETFDVLFFNATYEQSDIFRRLSKKCGQSWTFEHNEMTDSYYNEMAERFQKSSRILVPSAFLKDRIYQRIANVYYKEVTVFPIPIDSNIFYFQPNPMGRIVHFITCCAIKRIRNLEFTIRVLWELHRRNVSFIWDIYGEVPFKGEIKYLQELHSLIDELSLSGSIKFHNALSQQCEVAEALHHADFYIDFAVKETYGMAKIEAAMAGTRMILPPVDNNLIFNRDMISYIGSSIVIAEHIEETIRECRDNPQKDIAERLTVREAMMLFAKASVSTTIRHLLNETV